MVERLNTKGGLFTLFSPFICNLYQFRSVGVGTQGHLEHLLQRLFLFSYVLLHKTPSDD